MDYTRFLSRRALRLLPSAIRALQPLVSLPGMISLGGGYPNARLFPFKGLTLQVPAPPSHSSAPAETVKLELSPGKVAEALQYSPSYGLPSLLEKLSRLQKREHRPPRDTKILVTTGSQDALSKVFDLCLDEGDIALTEDPTYSGALSALNPTGCRLVGVPCDKDGLDPAHLKRVLESFQGQAKRPKLLYTIPTGQNPSGATLTNDRRRAVYDLASKHDILIIEDDPYWNLQLPARGPSTAAREPLHSFLSLDVDGRVIRLDSMSKVLSSGLRVGWATGPGELIEKLQLNQQASALHTCGMSQVMVEAILDHWGEQGWKDHIQQVQAFYGQRCDAFMAFAAKHLASRPVDWATPSAGMFVWFRLREVPDTEKLIKERALAQKVLLVPGGAFSPSGAKSSFVRASFSVATDEQMDEAMRRFASLLDSSE